MNRLCVIANTAKPRAADVLRQLAAAAAGLGIDLVGDADVAAREPAIPARSSDDDFTNIEAVIALGGDGTMLRAVRALGGRDIPLIGVNIGSLGFMTSVAENDLHRALECLVQDDFTFSHRTVAECTVRRDGKQTVVYRALNDIVLSGGASSRVITIALRVGDDLVASYVCDGLIVSTPTGSTGHNLSAGGPIMIPENRALVISLICPHTLSSRPLVVPDDRDICIEGGAQNDVGLRLSVDGQVGQTVTAGDRVHVRAGAVGVRFIHLPGYSYFSVLSQKLGWKGSNVR
jgi:NAD+ kinase